MAKKTTKTSSVETLEPRVYEVGYLLSPAIRDEDLAAKTDELKETLTKLGGSVISEGAPEFIDLAYEMVRVIDNKNVRFNQAYFGWIKLEIEPSAVTAIKEVFDANIFIIRYLLTKTIRENTVVGKKSLGKILKGKRNGSEFDEEGSSEAVEIESVPEENLDQVLDEEIKELVKEI
jgi:ribosomal protein S6